MKVQRWTGPAMTASDAGGFVAVGDYMALIAVVEAAKAMRDYCSIDNQSNPIITEFDAALRALEP